MAAVVTVVVVFLFHLSQSGGSNCELSDCTAKAFQILQMMLCFSSDFSKDNVFEVEEGAGCKSDEEATVVCILFTYTAQQSWSVMGQLEGLIAEGWPINRAVAAFQVSQLGISARH